MDTSPNARIYPRSLTYNRFRPPRYLLIRVILPASSFLLIYRETSVLLSQDDINCGIYWEGRR